MLLDCSAILLANSLIVITSGILTSLFTGFFRFKIQYNNLCPPYPECLTKEYEDSFNPDLLGYQHTSECEEETVCDEDSEVKLWGWCFNIEETIYLNLYNYLKNNVFQR